MKQSEFTKCLKCGKGVMHSNVITFYRLKLDYLVTDLRAVQRQAGLEAFMGSPVLASAMGPNEDLAKELVSYNGLLCYICAMDTNIAELHEHLGDVAKKDEEKTLSAGYAEQTQGEHHE